MSTLDIQLLYRRSKGIPLIIHHLLPDLALGLTLNGSNYPYPKQIFMVPKSFKPLRIDRIFFWSVTLPYLIFLMKPSNVFFIFSKNKRAMMAL